MVVAWNKDRVGSYSKDITIAADAVTKLATPSYMHVGDELEARVLFDDLVKDKKDVSFKVTCTGALECSLDKSIALDKSKAHESLKLKALNEGVGTVSLKVKSGSYTYDDSYEVDVLPNKGKVLESAILPLKVNEQATFKLIGLFSSIAFRTLASNFLSRALSISCC